MRARISKLMAGLMALAALAFGGAALASAGSKQSPAAPPTTAVQTSGVDGDQLQEGDQSAPDAAAGEQSDPAQESATEQADSASAESSSEQVASDGPGGHADEPGNANADHQFQGQE